MSEIMLFCLIGLSYQLAWFFEYFFSFPLLVCFVINNLILIFDEFHCR